MDLRATTPGPGAAAGYAADALLVLLVGEGLPAGLEPALAKMAQAALDSGDLALKPGRCLYLHGPAGVKAPRVVLAAAGAQAHGRAQRAALAAGLAHCKAPGVKHLAVCVAGAAPDATALAAAVADASYLYRHTKPGAPAAPALERVSLLCADKVQAQAAGAGLATGTAVAAGVRLARELANRPGNHCTPSDLAAQARQLAREHGLKVDVLDRKDCEKLGMGAFLAVAQGSAEPPRFIVLRYQGAAKAEPPVVLVGKGITFDTGGISIKPAAGMDEMKFDMGGAASVLGTLRAVAELKPALNVVGLVPACENMPGGRAVKPGDVVTSMAGTTIEILNTDAEGRLILCDALAYARRFNPALVVDVATLTGACVVALGHHRTGLFTPDDALAQALLAAGEQALDPAWRMPVDDEYDDALKSNFADMANVGPREGGAITAAMFLKRFTSAYRWAHLDIAGSAWKTGAAKGATGRPVGLLTHFVLGQAQAAAQPARKPRAR